jgi:hypothetical protein
VLYHYKLWTSKAKRSHAEISDFYPIYLSRADNMMLINMRYGKNRPVLQFPFFKDKAGNVITGLFFTINEKPMSADDNKDSKVNHEDVILARKKK